MLPAIARLAHAAPKRILVCAALLTIGAGIAAGPVATVLSSGGQFDPASESARAATLMAEKFGQTQQQMLITVNCPAGVADGPARDVGSAIVADLSRSPHVASVESPWTAPPAAASAMISTDHTAALIVANIRDDDNRAPAYAKDLADQFVHDRDGVTVRAGGVVLLPSQVTEQATRDLAVMESIAIPISFVVLVWVFGGALAAALPVAVGMMAIVGSMAALRCIALFTEVSTFALNIGAGLGLALAVDYTLLIVSRYRDEITGGATPADALTTTLVTAGRTVCFSAATFVLSMVAMLMFPMAAIKSLGYAGIATVAVAAVAALFVTPAAIVVLGDRLNAADVRVLIRRLLRRPPPAVQPVEARLLYRSTTLAMRHAIPVALGALALLIVLGLPAAHLRLGIADDRMLPTSAPARQVGDQLRQQFPGNQAATATAVIPDADGVPSAEIDRYAAALSRVSDVTTVSAPTGIYLNGVRAGPSSAAAADQSGGAAFLTIDSAAPLLSAQSQHQLDEFHRIAGPAGRQVLIGGLAQINRDSVAAIVTVLPLVLAAIALTTFVLLFFLTASVVVPLKALALNVFSLGAMFGVLVWIFQDGHLGALGTTATGVLPTIAPLPLFCTAFALSMDYELFLVARIREYWQGSAGTAADINQSVALGLATSGRVVTAAAFLMVIPFAAQIGSSVLRIFGVGLALAILIDATIVRLILLPALMSLLGRWNWWAPSRVIRPSRDRSTEASPDAVSPQRPAR